MRKTCYQKGCQNEKKVVAKKVVVTKRFGKRIKRGYNWDLNSHPTNFQPNAQPHGLNVTCSHRVLKVVYKGMLKLNGIGVYLWFTERIQANFCLHPCTDHAVNDEQQQL